ncbi:MAG: hypothetical protein EU535_08145 [Promethearchaeota archaeon]|nr:MAG: hypothetical protein EU535_08145 [Candidatus Lokiarchaeota archaeon]
MDEAIIEIETPNKVYKITFDQIEEKLKYVWDPELEDDGPCYILVRASDTKDNVAISDTMLVFPRNALFLTNTLLAVSVITLAAMVIANKYVKRTLMNEPIMDYFQNILDFIKYPKKMPFKKLNPLNLLNLKVYVSSKIEEIGRLIKKGERSQALDICDALLNIHYPLARKSITPEMVRLISDIKYDLQDKLKNKK